MQFATLSYRQGLHLAQLVLHTFHLIKGGKMRSLEYKLMQQPWENADLI